MAFGPKLAEIRQLARFPKTAHQIWLRDAARNLILFGQSLKHGQINRFGSRGKAFLTGRCLQITDKNIQRVETWLRLAPEQLGDWRDM